MKVRFAVSPHADHLGLDEFGRAVDDLEAMGFDTVWLPDVPLGGQLDPLLGLAFAAGRTDRLKLGGDIVPAGRNPLNLAKSLAQLDRISGGRLLVSFVSGVGQTGERDVLRIGKANRAKMMEEITPLLRAWWAGETVDHHSEHFDFPGIASPARPIQDPLEVWFGGSGPLALARVGQFADGWLGSAMTPLQAAPAVARIQDAAQDAGRRIDPEHFGLSIPYAEAELHAGTLVRLRRLRPDIDLTDLVPVGRGALRDLLSRHVDAGISKFVIRTEARGAPSSAQLERLAEVLLPLQS